MTIKDIARLAETSVATVSRVLNDDPKVAPSTRAKVLQVVQENNYTPNITGRTMRTKKSNKVLVIIPTIVNSFYSKILQGIEARAEENGYEVLIAISNLEEIKERKYIDMLKTKQVDGCISLFSLLDANDIDQLASDYPFIQACEPTVGSHVSSVSVDNRQAMYDVTEDFIKQGHKRIGMISGDYYKYSELNRERGYKDALIDHEIKYDESLLIKKFYRYRDGGDALNELMALDNPPTAVICVSDSLAIGAVNQLLKMGKKPGKDVSIIGFDNTSITSNYVPSISTIAQPRFEIGTNAFDLLLDKLNENDSTSKKVILPYQIIHRDSTKTK
jgi:LacI family repressor for deo operon, udp, cdd, tsx, nupC, and nupG